MPIQTLKILIIGPKQAGKTTIANFLSQQSDRLVGQHPSRPTVGARILEIEIGQRNVELWDISGNQAYENCWPAIVRDADGVILIYNPESHIHESEAMLWYEHFVEDAKLDPTAQCLVFEHTESEQRSKKLRAPAYRVIPTSHTSLNLLKAEFEKFVIAVEQHIASRARQQK